MKTGMYRKVVIIILALQAIANIVIFLFFINYITNPNSEFNRNIAQMVKQQAQSFKPLDGIKGDKGEQGVQGDRGPKGDTGQTGKDGTDSTSTNTTVIHEIPIKGDKGDTGPQGQQGEQGVAGPVAQFRCNPNTFKVEYKYPADEEWTSMNAFCISSQ